ncbi:MAG: hypothetical protein F6K56_44395, partial [Moorea sp. SIO3G5]|nr:hypothetical protein [Moorena sp. SIO3G5]
MSSVLVDASAVDSQLVRAEIVGSVFTGADLSRIDLYGARVSSTSFNST